MTSRRNVLKIAGLLGGATIVGGTLATGPAYALDKTARTPRSFKAAFVTDVHINVTPGAADTNLSAVFADMQAQSADFVVNAGDITEFGSQLEFDNYRALIPSSLQPRIYHAAGNHESRWDPTGLQAFSDNFGAGPRSFDFGGVHFVILEAAPALQEAAYLGEDQLAWLDRDLSFGRSPKTPTVVILHYPMGEQNYYVNDADRFFETVKPYSVRAIFAGHVHRTDVRNINGITSVTGRSSKNEPTYYTFERVLDANRDVLEISMVQLPRTGTTAVRTAEVLATIDLGKGAVPHTQAPLGLSAEFDGATVSITGKLNNKSGTVRAEAQVWEQAAYARRSPGTWTALAIDGGLLSGSLDASALLPGTHRIRVRLVDGEGAYWEETLRVDRPGGTVTPLSTLQLDGVVQGGLVTAGGYVIATTDKGVVSALTVGSGSIRAAWSATIGPVHRQPAVSDDGGTIYVPSADRKLHALDAADGRERWATDLGGPSLAAPLVTKVDGEPRVVAIAVDQAHCLDSDGKILWTARIPVLFCGKPASDGNIVVIPAGDGQVYGFDARTGSRVWSFATNTRPDAYRRLIYGPWTSFVTAVDNGLALVGTVSNLHALDFATGSQAWSLPGSHVYTPPLVVGEHVLAIAERGQTSFVHAATGAVQWKGTSVPLSLDAGPVLRGVEAFHLGFTGMLAKVNLDSGQGTPLRQVTAAHIYSTPVLLEGVLVAAGQDGVIHALDLAGEASATPDR